MLYKEIIYLCLDEIKSVSDDSFFTEEHILFLVSKYRNMIIKQRYSDVKKPIPESNYQTICLDLEPTEAIDTSSTGVNICGNEIFLKSSEKVPYIMPIGATKVFPVNYYVGEITYVSRERMKYVGYNKYLQNIIYASIGPDGHLYMKSNNPQFAYLEKAKVTGIFEDIEAASNLECGDDDNDENNGNTPCDILDKEFPLEEALVPPIVELVVKELLGSAYRPADFQNNSMDDLADLAAFVRQNMKSNLAKQITE